MKELLSLTDSLPLYYSQSFLSHNLLHRNSCTCLVSGYIVYLTQRDSKLNLFLIILLQENKLFSSRSRWKQVVLCCFVGVRIWGSVWNSISLLFWVHPATIILCMSKTLPIIITLSGIVAHFAG